MTHDTLTIGRRFALALADEDVDAALALSDPEIELPMPRGTLRGHDGVRRLLATPPPEHLECQILVDDVVNAGERVVALARMRYTWRESGECAGVHHVGAVLDPRNGLVTRWQPFPDPEAALAAARCAPTPPTRTSQKSPRGRDPRCSCMPPLTTAVAGASLALAACGSRPGNERATGAAADVRATPAPRVSTAQYAKRAAALKTAIDDARSRYFHGNGSPKAVMGQLRNVRAAYSDAAERLAAIEPPQAATELHTKLVALWRKRTSQVAELLGARRYRSSRVSDLMYATDADNTLYNDIYTRPQ